MKMFETINRIKLEEKQKSLIPKDLSERGSNIQKEFLELVICDPQGFAREIKQLGIDDQNSNTHKPPPVPQYSLTESEFLDPPWSTEKELWDIWKSLKPDQAHRTELWTRFSVELISQNKINSSFLTASGQTSGKSRIAKALKINDPVEIDKCVRTVFRRLGGLPAARGNRTSFIDCTIAKCWWRHFYAREAHRQFDSLKLKNFSDALRPSWVWEVFVESMVSKMTVIAAQTIRNVIIWLLVQGKISNRKQLEALRLSVGKRCITQALPSLKVVEVEKIIEDEILALIQ